MKMLERSNKNRIPLQLKAKKYMDYENKLIVLGYDGTDRSLLRCGRSLVIGEYVQTKVTIYNTQTYSQSSRYDAYYGLGNNYQTSVIPRESSYNQLQSKLKQIILFVDQEGNSTIKLDDIFDTENNIISWYIIDRDGVDTLKSGGNYIGYDGKIETLKVIGNIEDQSSCFKTIKTLQNLCETLDLQGLTIKNINYYTDWFKSSRFKKIILNKTGSEQQQKKEKSLSAVNKVVKFDGVFQNCINLEEIDFNGIDLQQVEDTQQAFKNCEKLRKVDFGQSLNNNNRLHYVEEMFKYCRSLEEINFGNFSETQELRPSFHVFDRVPQSMKLITKNKDLIKFLENNRKNFRNV